jgi:alpha-1,6-mannosyltransferase
MFAVSLLIVGAAENRLDVLVPAAKRDYPGWMRGPLGWLEIGGATPARLAWLLLALFGCFLVAWACADTISARVAIGSIAGLHVLFMLAPPLLSSDVFGYIDLGRLGAVHGIDPYSAASTHVPPDSVHLYRRWDTDAPSPYGPLFTAITYPIGALGVPAAFWTLKALFTAASLATIALVWRCAERLGRDPERAALFVGLNPILLLFGVGGAHNDFFLALGLVGGIALVLGDRERPGAAALTLGAAVKASAALPLAFLLVRPGQRRARLAGIAVASGAVLVLSAAMFGTDVLRLAGAIRDQQSKVALFSVPNEVGLKLGLGGMTDGIRAVAIATFVASLAWLVVRTARGADWIAAAGWATLALLVTSAWLLPWYLVWLLPLAALADDRRLRAAAIALCAFIVYTRVDLWLRLGG